MSGFLHERADFKDLLEITAEVERINDPSLVEKDYWIMHVLWGLQQLNLTFYLKGGTSLSKGYGCIHRFSEDIDLLIEPDEKCGFNVFTGKNHDKPKHRESRKAYFDWIATYLENKLPGIVSVVRDTQFDDADKSRNGGVRLHYATPYTVNKGIKNGILLEVGFDRVAPNQPKHISSWAYRLAASKNVVAIDNQAINVPCYDPKYTFVEKLQAVTRKFRLYKASIGTGESRLLPENFIRHYYDLYQLIDLPDVQAFIGTEDYEAFKLERFGGDDPKIANSDALRLHNSSDRALFEKEYARSESLYFKGRPSLAEILERFGRDLDRL